MVRAEGKQQSQGNTEAQMKMKNGMKKKEETKNAVKELFNHERESTAHQKPRKDMSASLLIMPTLFFHFQSYLAFQKPYKGESQRMNSFPSSIFLFAGIDFTRTDC